MIVLKIANLQALAKQPATSSIGQNYTPADSRTPLLALRTCPPSSFWGFLEINFFEFFHSTMLKYGQSHTCAGKLATPRRLLSNFYSNTTPKAAEQSVVLTLTRKSSGDHLSLQTTSFSLATNNFLCDCCCKSDWRPERSFWILLQDARWNHVPCDARMPSRVAHGSRDFRVTFVKCACYSPWTPVGLEVITLVLLRRSRTRWPCCRPTNRDFPWPCRSKTSEMMMKSHSLWRKKSLMQFTRQVRAASAARVPVNTKGPS